MKIKTIIQGSFFLAILSIALIYSIKSKNGLRAYFDLKNDFQQDMQNIAALEKKNDDIKKEITQWKIDPLEQEKTARQDLGMSFTNELVYITPKQQKK